MTFDFMIRSAKLADADEISELEKTSFSMPWSKTLIEREIQNDNAVFLAAIEEEGLLLGYISGQQITDEFYISNIAVRADWRRRGVGSALMQQLIDTAWDRGCVFVTLEVRVSNHAARKMYESFGFIPLGERKDYYQNPQENAMIYTLYLNMPEAADENFGN